MGGKEGGRGGWPFESFPARTCVDEVLPQTNLHVMLAAAAEESGHLLFLTFFLKIPHLGSGEDSWNFFTLSLIPGSPSLLVNNDHEEERIEEEQQIVIFSLYDRTITSAPFAPFRLGDLNSCSRTYN